LATAAVGGRTALRAHHQACGPSSSTSRLQRISLPSGFPPRRRRRRCALPLAPADPQLRLQLPEARAAGAGHGRPSGRAAHACDRQACGL